MQCDVLSFALRLNVLNDRVLYIERCTTEPFTIFHPTVCM